MELKLKHLLACSVAVIALPGVALAQSDATIESVTVTGSRIVSNGNDAPTPVTVVSSAQLLTTTPTSIPDGLNKLPAFTASNTPQQCGLRRQWPRHG